MKLTAAEMGFPENYRCFSGSFATKGYMAVGDPWLTSPEYSKSDETIVYQTDDAGATWTPVAQFEVHELGGWTLKWMEEENN